MTGSISDATTKNQVSECTRDTIGLRTNPFILRLGILSHHSDSEHFIQMCIWEQTTRSPDMIPMWYIRIFPRVRCQNIFWGVFLSELQHSNIIEMFQEGHVRSNKLSIFQSSLPIIYTFETNKHFLFTTKNLHFPPTFAYYMNHSYFFILFFSLPTLFTLEVLFHSYNARAIVVPWIWSCVYLYQYDKSITFFFPLLQMSNIYFHKKFQ